jgi:hypothetical protein
MSSTIAPYSRRTHLDAKFIALLSVMTLLLLKVPGMRKFGFLLLDRFVSACEIVGTFHPRDTISCLAPPHQVMITARAPRILFSNNRRLAEPRLPKCVPLTKVDGPRYWVLKFEIPAQGKFFPAKPYQPEPFFAFSLLQPELNLPPFSSASFNFRSAAMVSMVSQYNALLDLRCTHYIFRHRRLFCSAKKSISVDTANCGTG